MKIRTLHNWDLSYAEARAMQTRLAGQVEFTPFKSKEPFLVAGLDCAFSERHGHFGGGIFKHSHTEEGDRRSPLQAMPPIIGTLKLELPTNNDHGQDAHATVIAAVVVLRIPDFEVVETADAAVEVTFPYIPGLLSFREAPACIAAAEKLKTKPNLIIVDGQGIAHPRRLGIAAHLGLFFDRPTIGCAKSRLIGDYGTLGKNKGASASLTDKNEVIGAVVRTRRNVKPVYVSVGNKCLLKNAIELILRCTTKYRLPEPTRLAHQLVTRLKAS
jgi:deoxyribonuclease V